MTKNRTISLKGVQGYSTNYRAVKIRNFSQERSSYITCKTQAALKNAREGKKAERDLQYENEALPGQRILLKGSKVEGPK